MGRRRQGEKQPLSPTEGKRYSIIFPFFFSLFSSSFSFLIYVYIPSIIVSSISPPPPPLPSLCLLTAPTQRLSRCMFSFCSCFCSNSRPCSLALLICASPMPSAMNHILLARRTSEHAAIHRNMRRVGALKLASFRLSSLFSSFLLLFPLFIPLAFF